jgi:guanylate kinase
MTKIIAIVGPTCSGKSHLLEYIKRVAASTNEVGVVLNTTTRNPRVGEVDGYDMNFISSKTFNEWSSAGRFIERSSTNGNQYGITFDAVEEAVHGSISGAVFVIVDPTGAKSLQRAFKGNSNVEVHTCFISTPTEVLIERLKERTISDALQVTFDMMMTTNERERSALEDIMKQVISTSSDRLSNLLLNESYWCDEDNWELELQGHDMSAASNYEIIKSFFNIHAGEN